ncbi:leucine-rich repeat and WD repeat-containing protein 1 isoform X3 [Paramormyrops kingsleyae]|uniref:leucine-rich repeat and WD repeat-containing protein 1 isoform X3 n=1 Tax=Paramormyrops kingsleyae TaxID=1676925 RepID=UPI003B978BE4
MVKITENMLLERGTPKTDKLEHIRTLNLSKLGLCSKDLPVSLLCRLCNLEQLDLSGNRLEGLPSGLRLPSLRVLDCSDNNMENVASLQSLCALEELRLEGNIYLTVSDHYKLMFLLSKLRVFDGKDISSTARHLRHVESENLRKRVVGLWEANFSLPDNPTAEKLKALEGEFVRAARAQIKYGPSSVNDYIKWRVEMLAKEYLRSLAESEREERGGVSAMNEQGVLSTPKRKQEATGVVENEGSTPKRPRRADTPPAEDSPRKSSRLQGTPVKVDKPMESSRKGDGGLGSPRKSIRLLTTPVKADKPMESPREGDGGLGSPKKSIRLLTTPMKADKPMESPREGDGGLGSTRKSIRLLTTPVKANKPMESPREGDGGLGSPKKSIRLLTTPMKADKPMESPREGDGGLGSTRKSIRLLTTPVKANKPMESPREGDGGLGSPTGKRLRGESLRILDGPGKATPLKGKKVDNLFMQVHDAKPKEPVTLLPLHVLQCHSKRDSPEDFSTQLWACAFEPPLEDCNSSQESRIVATCGGESVCLIDCETGHVLKKYKVPGEEFFSLSWTRLMMSRDGGVVRPCTVLAAGGKRGIVKLIHPRASVAYGEFRASRRSLSTLRFSSQQQSFLFTGAYDNKIVMWDVGGMDSNYKFEVRQLLVLETDSTPLQLGLPPSGPDSHLLAGCDGGLLNFNIQLSQNVLKRSPVMEITFPVYKKDDRDRHYRTVDGLGFLSEDVVVSKCHMAGCIYLWSWRRTQATRPNKTKEVPAAILAVLQWSCTDVPYLSLSTCPSEGYVVCGDEDGQLWTYHLPDISRAAAKTDRTISPTEVLQWPSPVRNGGGPVEGPSINSVAVGPRVRYLVALSDKNMVIVWKRL